MAVDALKRKFEGAGTNVLSANKILRHTSPGTGLSTQPGGGCTYCAMRPSTKSVRGKKGGRLSKPRHPKVQYVIGLYTLVTH